jgi:hypothetical protein
MTKTTTAQMKNPELLEACNQILDTHQKNLDDIQKEIDSSDPFTALKIYTQNKMLFKAPYISRETHEVKERLSGRPSQSDHNVTIRKLVNAPSNLQLPKAILWEKKDVADD